MLLRTYHHPATMAAPSKTMHRCADTRFHSSREKIAISKTTIAQMLGTTKETFSRMLHRLAEHKVLTYRGSQIRIQNSPRLKKIADGEEKI